MNRFTEFGCVDISLASWLGIEPPLYQKKHPGVKLLFSEISQWLATDLCREIALSFHSRSKEKRGTENRAPLGGWARRLSFACKGNPPAPGAELKLEAHRQLRLPRIAYALAQEAVEVEKGRRTEGVDIVLVVEGVEHLKPRDQRHSLA